MKTTAKAIRQYLIIIPTYDMDIRSYRTQILISLLIANISGAKYLLNFSWDKKLFEFGWKVVNPVGDMEVTDYKHEYHFEVGYRDSDSL